VIVWSFLATSDDRARIHQVLPRDTRYWISSIISTAWAKISGVLGLADLGLFEDNHPMFG